MLYRYTPAPGPDESPGVKLYELYENIPTLQSAFEALEGFPVRFVRRSAHTNDIADIVFPWPFSLHIRREGTVSCIEKGTRISDLDSARKSALADILQRVNNYMMRNVPTLICISCEISVVTRHQCGLRLGTTDSGLLEYAVCDNAFYCENEACFVAVQNGMKNDMAHAKAHVQATSAVPFTSTLTCFNPICAIMQSAEMPFKTCSGCLSVKYCSVSCQRAAWDTHKVRCRAINAARKTAKAEKKAREGAA